MPMKALILVGGFGTRLRPLTFTKPKPLVEFANLPIVEHQIAALVEVGVDEVVLAVNYQPKIMMAGLNAIAEKYGIKVRASQETVPLGTAGPLALAREHLDDGSGDPFFVFNSDVICQYPLKELLAFHKAHGQEGTILVKRVEDPSKYGVVVHDGDGKILRFVEKPQKFVGDCINAGMYIFNPAILDRIELKPTSIERVIFPAMAAEGQLYSMKLPGYWMDIGQPKDYLTGMCLHIAAVGEKMAAAAAATAAADASAAGAGAGAGAGSGAAAAAAVMSADDGVTAENIAKSVIIHPTASVAADAKIGPNVVIGAKCVVESGARIERSCLMAGCTVKAHAYVTSSIIGWNSVVGQWARTENVTVLGEHVTIKDTVALNGVRVLPHKGVGASEFKEGTIIM